MALDVAVVDVAVVVDARQAVCQGPRFQVALVVLRLGDSDGDDGCSAVQQGGKIGAGAGEDPHGLDARLGARPERLVGGGTQGVTLVGLA